jgi:hypothetical protein
MKYFSSMPGEDKLESRLANRLKNLESQTKHMADRLKEKEYSEEAIASFLSMHERINDLVGGLWGEKNSQEKLLVELNEGVRGITDSLVLGSSEERFENQDKIANSPGALQKGIRKAVREASGTEKIGSIGPNFLSERKV